MELWFISDCCRWRRERVGLNLFGVQYCTILLENICIIEFLPGDNFGDVVRAIARIHCVTRRRSSLDRNCWKSNGKIVKKGLSCHWGKYIFTFEQYMSILVYGNLYSRILSSEGFYIVASDSTSQSMYFMIDMGPTRMNTTKSINWLRSETRRTPHQKRTQNLCKTRTKAMQNAYKSDAKPKEAKEIEKIEERGNKRDRGNKGENLR